MVFDNAALQALGDTPLPGSRSSSPLHSLPLKEERPHKEEETPSSILLSVVISYQVCPYCKRDYYVTELYDEDFLNTPDWRNNLEDLRINTPGDLTSFKIRKYLYQHFIMSGY